MIDLHMHTTNSDGSLSTSELLKRAQEKGLTVISITDHNSVGAYRELEKPDIRDLFSGRIINGIEITAQVDGLLIEILGYGIDTKQMARLIKNYPSGDYEKNFFKKQTIANIRELGFNLGEIENLPSRELWLALTKNKEFCDKVNPKFYNNTISYIFRAGVTNKSSPLFCDTREYLKSAEEVVDMIHKCGGAAFIAHPAEYMESCDKVLEYTKDFVDGIECFHPSHDKDMQLKLCKFCLKHKLLISGGSDFHGKLKPHIEIGIGCGDLVIPKELLSWL